MRRPRSFTHVDKSTSRLSPLSGWPDSPNFLSLLLKFVSVVAPSSSYSIWFAIQICPGLQISDTPISVPFTKISVASSAVWPQSSLIDIVQHLIPNWDPSHWLSMPPDWVSDKPNHARVQESKVFTSVDDLKLGEMANMKTFKSSWVFWKPGSRATKWDLTAVSLNSKYHLINIDDGKNGLTVLCEKTGLFLLIISSVWCDLAALKANPLVGCINRIASKSRKAIISVGAPSTGQATADYSVVIVVLQGDH